MTRTLIRRPTAMTGAFLAAAATAGIDTSKARVPHKTEPGWSVTRRQKRK